MDYGSTGNNGNLLTQTIAGSGLGQAVIQSYGYEGLNRLASARENLGTATGTEVWSRGFGYDAYANGWVSSASTSLPTGSFAPTSSTWFNSTNRLVNSALPVGYDLSGNQNAVGGNGSTYDGENRMLTSTINSVTTSYAYDGDGRRVKKGAVTYDGMLFLSSYDS